MTTTELLNKFYSAFQQRDYETMQSCYHPEAQFSDPVFQNLSTQQVKAMWHMLCERGKDLKIEFTPLGEHLIFWEAQYSFSKTKRIVNNEVTATFEFKEGLIYKHTDEFDLWKWAGMALGLTGALLGWASFFKSKIRKTGMSSLRHFIKNHTEYH